MPGPKLILKRLRVVLLVLGAACPCAFAWIGRETRKCAGVGWPPTAEIDSKQSFKFPEKGWIKATIAASTLAFGLHFPALADETPILLPEPDQAVLSPLKNELSVKRVSEPLSSDMDRKSTDTALSTSDIISENSIVEATSTESTQQESETKTQPDVSAEGISEDSLTSSHADSLSVEDHGLESIEEIATSQGSVGASGNDDHFLEAPTPIIVDEKPSPGLETNDGIAEATSDIMADLNAISGATQDADSSEEHDVRKLAATDENETSGPIQGTPPAKPLASVSQVSRRQTDLGPIYSEPKKDLIGDKERELEEEEYVHHDLSEAQIAWLRKH